MREQIAAVRRMQDHIEAHLFEEITPAALAEACHYSPWYAHRLFVKWLGRTPADYVRRLRLSRTALRLRDEGCRVTDVALSSGFGSVDGYQRAFYREFGCNPREYAAHPTPLYLFTPYKLLEEPERKAHTMETVKTVFVKETEKPARKALVKRGVTAEDYYRYCEEVGCDIWGYLLSVKQATGEPVGLWLPAAMHPKGTSTYVQGVELPLRETMTAPEGMDIIDLPAALYLHFQGEPFAEDDYEQAITEVWEAIKKFDPAAHGYAWDDTNPRIQLEPRGERGYIELMPVRRV